MTRALSRSVEFAGESRAHDRVLAAAFTRANVRYHRAPAGKAWRVHSDDADDAMAVLEADGHTIEVTL